MKTIFDKKKNQFETRDMTFNSLEKTLGYLTIEESLRSEDYTEYYSCKGIFLYVFFYPE